MSKIFRGLFKAGAFFWCGVLARQLFDIVTNNTTPNTAGALIISAMGAAMMIVASIELENP